jgi:hypothetical protein
MLPQQKEFAGQVECPFCKNEVPMEIVSRYSQAQTHYRQGPDNTWTNAEPASWDEGYVYELLKCPACFNVALRRYYFHEPTWPEGAELETLYPTRPRAPDGLPDHIAEAYRVAENLRRVDPNAFANQVGRLLDLVCQDRGANGKDLYSKLENLASRGELPDRLVEVAKNARRLRNVAAHPELGELSWSDVPLQYRLCLAILEYVYTAPYLVTMAEQRLKSPSKLDTDHDKEGAHKSS